MDDWLIGGGIAVAVILGLAALTAWAFKKAIERAEQERRRMVREVVRELEEKKQLPLGSE